MAKFTVPTPIPPPVRPRSWPNPQLTFSRPSTAFSTVPVFSITGDDSIIEFPTPTGNFNLFGSGSITTTGSANTETISLIGLTNHNVLVGAGTSTIGLIPPSTAGFVLTSNGPGSDPTFQANSGGSAIMTITGNTGGAETPLAGNFNVLGTGSITIAGSANTETVQLTGLTDHNVLVGAGTATITKVAPSATSGVPLISQGGAADPTFGTAVVAGGGTGDTSFTAYAPICGGTTTTNPLQSASTGIATAGFILTSNGNAALPSFQTAAASGAVMTLTGDTGGAISPTAGNINLLANTNAGATVKFSGSGSTLSLLVTQPLVHDTFIGLNAGVATLTSGGNTSVGWFTCSALDATSTGNSAFGNGALTLCTSGSNNTGIGLISLNALTTGSGNTALGGNTCANLLTGSNNTAVGLNAGSSYTTSESSNICIKNTGTAAESNVIRIGTNGSGAGQQNQCFIAGIDGVNVGSVATVVTEASNKLGTATITAGSGITVTPGANTITIAATAGAGGGLTWTDVTGASQTIAAGNGYLSNRAGAVAFTLPASGTVGDVFRIVGVQGSWTLAQAANQQIKFGNTATTVGVTGSLASANAGDCVECVATNTSASTVWRVMSSIGNITVA